MNGAGRSTFYERSEHDAGRLRIRMDAKILRLLPSDSRQSISID